MKTLPKTASAISILFLTLTPSILRADAVTDWHTFRATTATTLSGQGTADPVFGSLAEPSSTGVLVGYLNAPLSLVNIGDKITFTFDLSFNDALGMTATTPDQFRFALFDLNGETKVIAENSVGSTAGSTDTDGLRGYWFGVKSGASGAQGSMRERSGTTGDQNPFANASATLLGTAGGTSVTYSGAVNGVGGEIYSGEMTLELQVGGLSLTGFFSGNGGANAFSFLDSTPITTANYEAVAFLNGGSMSADQILFQNVSVSYLPVPEPSAAALFAIGIFGVGLRLRRFRKLN